MPYKDPKKKKEYQKKYHNNYDASYYQRNIDNTGNIQNTIIKMLESQDLKK